MLRYVLVVQISSHETWIDYPFGLYKNEHKHRNTNIHRTHCLQSLRETECCSFPKSAAEENVSNFSASMAEHTLHYQCLAAGRKSGKPAQQRSGWNTAGISKTKPSIYHHAKTAKGLQWHRLVRKLARAAEWEPLHISWGGRRLRWGRCQRDSTQISPGKMLSLSHMASQARMNGEGRISHHDTYAAWGHRAPIFFSVAWSALNDFFPPLP